MARRPAPPGIPRGRPARAPLLALLAAGLAAGAPPALDAAAPRKPRVARASNLSARPDRTLYEQARRLETRLRASSRLQAQRGEWEKAVLAYRRLVARYPQSPYCDNALLAVGDLYRDMAARFEAARYRDDAIDAYRSLVAEYPSSSLGEKALYAVVEIQGRRGDRRRLGEAARAYLSAFPDGPRAGAVKGLVRRGAPERAASLPSAPPPGLARVFNLRSWSGPSSTRVVVDLERQVPIRFDRIADPDRLWIDLDRTRLHPNLTDRTFPVGGGLLEQVRMAQNREDVVRVVLDFKAVDRHTIFYLQDPPRLVIDVQGAARAQVAAAGHEAPASRGEPARDPSTAGPPGADGVPDAGRDDTGSPAPQTLPTRRVEVTAPSAEAATRADAPRGGPVEIDLASSPPAASPARTPEAPAPPRPNRSGAISLARQLGLGARRIVVDAGHGGHDPGTIGRAGLQEKDLVLDVAVRLAGMLRRELGADVVLTRSSDVFLPLEERTAIANSQGADLFLSIHANSSRNARARGVETYFLNFARNAHAEAVAARENAISAATLKDLQGLVKAIALSSKIDESRDFALSVQEALVGQLKSHYGAEVVDRGVHTAPFYVLIGANMPSVLAEIAFVSHPQEERRLKTGEHRERIARSLLAGVRRYLDELNRTQLRQLTSGDGAPRVGSRGTRR